ncbi:hypothetical protein B0T10DRAFT_480621 [Thelonectria olida]|uniref:Uncharacterized protein n=1 Tax=Thelonectria olida TaxID=1576542 RepID=A0A9P9AVL9_9HYPO|nr:hypothetical protein B0T10DRAFT_480621 [Thelonectria olida]
MGHHVIISSHVLGILLYYFISCWWCWDPHCHRSAYRERTSHPSLSKPRSMNDEGCCCLLHFFILLIKSSIIPSLIYLLPQPFIWKRLEAHSASTGLVVSNLFQTSTTQHTVRDR